MIVPFSMDTSTPRERPDSGPAHGPYSRNRWWMMPVPRVSVRNSLRYPNRPRAGILYSRRTSPCPGFFISIISALRGPSFSMTVPR